MIRYRLRTRLVGAEESSGNDAITRGEKPTAIQYECVQDQSEGLARSSTIACYSAVILMARDSASQSAPILVGMALVVACSPSWAQTAGQQAAIVVEATAEAADPLAASRVSTSDTASLLAGVDSAQAGGVSGLPIIHGLGDDRIRILVNGVPIAAACPMHMNPPLSYINPANTSRLEVLPGVTPVSLGGDSIGGTILVESAPPKFNATNGAVESDGSVSSFFRSNAAAIGAAAAASMTTSDLSFAYEVLVFGRRTIATVPGRKSMPQDLKPRTSKSRPPIAADKIYTRSRWRCRTCPMKGFPMRIWI